MNPTREQGRALAGMVADVMERYGADEYRQEVYLKFDRVRRQSTPPATPSRRRRMFRSEHAANDATDTIGTTGTTGASPVRETGRGTVRHRP